MPIHYDYLILRDIYQEVPNFWLKEYEQNPDLSLLLFPKEFLLTALTK